MTDETDDMIQDEEDDFTVDDSPIDSGNDANDAPAPAKKVKAKAKVKAKGDTSVKTASTATAKATKPTAKSTKSAAPAKKVTKVAAKAAKPAAKSAAAHAASNGNGNGRAAFPRDAVIHVTKKFATWTPKGSRLPDKIKLIKDGMTVGDFLDKRREKGFGSGSRPLFLAQEAGAITIK